MEFLPEAIDDALFGPDKIYLATRSYVRFLQILFSKWETYKWSEDENVSKIVIVRDLPEVLTVESKMPLIVVHNNGGMWRGPGPSQEFRGHIFRPNLFPKTFVDTVLTSVTIYCFARTDAESSKLAWTIFKAIPFMRQFLQQLPGISIIEHRLTINKPVDASQVLRNTGPGIAYVTTVYSPVHINETTTMHHEKIVKNILDDISAKLVSPTGEESK